MGPDVVARFEALASARLGATAPSSSPTRSGLFGQAHLIDNAAQAPAEGSCRRGAPDRRTPDLRSRSNRVGDAAGVEDDAAVVADGLEDGLAVARRPTSSR